MAKCQSSYKLDSPMSVADCKLVKHCVAYKYLAIMVTAGSLDDGSTSNFGPFQGKSIICVSDCCEFFAKQAGSVVVLDRLSVSGHMSQKEFDALGYPKIPDHWTKEWMLEQLELEKVDPRVNPNLLLEETQQEFWDNASRKPYAKAILKSEKHWMKRRNVWLRQYEQVELANMMREELTAELESCPSEVKRRVMPIMTLDLHFNMWGVHRAGKLVSLLI